MHQQRNETVSFIESYSILHGQRRFYYRRDTIKQKYQTSQLRERVYFFEINLARSVFHYSAILLLL